jgi:hypothetical protein
MLKFGIRTNAGPRTEEVESKNFGRLSLRTSHPSDCITDQGQSTLSAIVPLRLVRLTLNIFSTDSFEISIDAWELCFLFNVKTEANSLHDSGASEQAEEVLFVSSSGAESNSASRILF